MVAVSISESEVQKVIFEPIQKSSDPTQKLMMRQLINTVLTLQPQPDEATVRQLLNKLHETGISTRCTTIPARFIAADAASRSAIVRFPNAKEDQVVDMLLLLSGHWSATYMAFRSKELARVGALPFVDAKESELGRKAPLDELPFMAPSIIHRISAPFLFTRRPETDNSQGIFASRMHHRQYRQHIKHIRERLCPLFAASHTLHIEAIGTLKHHHRIDEVQPMLVEVGLPLGFVPKNIRAHRFYCSNSNY